MTRIGESEPEEVDEELEWLRKFSSRERDKILEEMEEIIGDHQLTLYQAAEHILKAGGKLLRPSFTLLASKAVNGDPEKVLPVAAASEFSHASSLIHDDIIDEDEMRREVPSTHVKFGKNAAILAGNLLIFKSFSSLARAASKLDSDKVVKILDMFSEAAILIDEGEYLDIELQDTQDVTEEDYFDMVNKKTAMAYKCALGMGAIAGEGTKEEIEALKEYGESFGIAFQIRDDLIGMLGDPAETGKPASDILKGRKTLAVSHALQKANEEDRDKLLTILERKRISEREAQKVINILEKYNSFNYSETKIIELILNAKSSLAILKDTPAKRFFLKLANLLARMPLTVLVH